MQIPASRLSEYTAALNAQQKAAYSYMQTMLQTFRQMNGAASLADVREFAEQALYACIAQFGSQAAAVACSAYDTTMEELGFGVSAAEPSVNVSGKSAARSVDYFMRGGVDDFDRFARSLAEKAYNEVGRAAHKTTIANAERDYRHGVRYARVPTGKETCGWCLMLASRGFAYTSAESAGYRGFAFNRFHDHCDCRVVAGDEGTTVEGYDPDWLYDVYKDARATVDAAGLHKQLAEQGMGSSEINRRVTNAISNEINRRNASWAWSGKECKPTVAAGAKPGKAALTAADALARHGLPAEIGQDGSMTINGMRWMLADGDPPGYGHLIAHSLDEARALVDSGATEVLAILDDGSIRRLTKQQR